MLTAAAIVTVGLAVAVNTVTLSAVEGVVLRSLHVPNASEPVAIETGVAGTSLEHVGLSTGEVYDLDRRTDLFRSAAGYRAVAMNLTATATPQRVSAIATIGPIFDVLEVRPYAGRFRVALHRGRGCSMEP